MNILWRNNGRNKSYFKKILSEYNFCFGIYVFFGHKIDIKSLITISSSYSCIGQKGQLKNGFESH